MVLYFYNVIFFDTDLLFLVEDHVRFSTEVVGGPGAGRVQLLPIVQLE